MMIILKSLMNSNFEKNKHYYKRKHKIEILKLTFFFIFRFEWFN